MPRPSITPEKRKKMRAHVREALVRIARQRELRPGDTKGWSGITIRDVIEEADISIGTFYKYFKDRADLAQTLWAEPVAALREKMVTDFERAESPEAKVLSQLTNYVNFALENPRLFRGAFLFVRPDGNAKPGPMELGSEPLFINLVAAFEEGQNSGDFCCFEPKAMAQTFWAGIHGSLALPVNLERFDFDDAEVLSSNMISSLMEMIRKPAAD